MAVYDADGNILSAVYDASGDSLDYAYDSDGTVIFQKELPVGISLKVMSYNVGGWYIGSGSNVPTEKYEQYLALQTGMIQRNDPDILIIQEYMATFSTGHSALTMLQGLFPYVKAVTGGTYFGRAICSKYPISNYVHNAFSAESNRYFDSVDVTIDDVTVTVITTHLGLSQAYRNSEIPELIAYCKQHERFICGGDYNINGTTGTPYEQNIAPFLNEGFNTANWGDFGNLVTCIEGTSLEDHTGCLDNVYTSSNIFVTNAHVDTTKLTDDISDYIDHMPIIADLVVPTES